MPGAPACSFPFRHGGGQAQQPADPDGEPSTVYRDRTLRAEVDDRQQKGQQAAVPTREISGIEAHPGYLRKCLDFISYHAGRRRGVGHIPLPGKG